MNLPLTELLACPTCGGPLQLSADGLRCSRNRPPCMPDGAVSPGLGAKDATSRAFYPVHRSRLLDLRPAEARDWAETFARQYRAARLAEGWLPLTPDLAPALPYADPPGFPRLYWPLRRESWARLSQLLARLSPPPLSIADAGAGFPWLSHRLAGLGYAVIALDLSADMDFGLGAARLFPTAADATDVAAHGLWAGRFLPVLADLAQPPLPTGAFAAVICNASLHYVNNLPATLGRLVRALRPGGALFVVDSPIALQGWAGDRPGSSVLGRGEVDAAMRNAGLKPTWYNVRRGPLWWQHQLKTRLLRRRGFDFPIVVGHA